MKSGRDLNSECEVLMGGEFVVRLSPVVMVCWIVTGGITALKGASHLISGG